MTQFSPKLINEFKEIYKKRGGEDLTDEKANEYANDFANLMEIIVDVAREEYLRKQRLKKEPKGFHLENGKYYSCRICGETKNGEDLWWDKYGTKCMDCQKNIDDKTIPKKLLRGKFPADNWFTSWQLKDNFGIHPSTAKKLVREGKLKSIELKDREEKIYHELFPIVENIDAFGDLEQIAN
jgi:RNA polymerase-binding transcription factor DksA